MRHVFSISASQKGEVERFGDYATSLDGISAAAKSKTFLGADNVEYVELPIADYQKLLQMAHESIKVKAMIHKFQCEFEECKKEITTLRILIEQLRQDYSLMTKNVG